MEDKYRNIRPWNDSEVAETLQRITASNTLLSGIARRRYPFLASHLLTPLMLFIRLYLRWQCRGVTTVRQVQKRFVLPHVKTVLDKYTDGLSYDGIANLLDGPVMLLSNHRDIVFDPTIISYVLYRYKNDSTRIAIGDNLLHIPFASDLMRLNKSFIVNRSETSIRKKYQALTLLSEYIHHSIDVDKQSIWVAHREGRAKDGIDKTDEAVIKMLCLADRKQPFSQQIDNLKLHIVTISYEYDPTATLKAEELLQRDTQLNYCKANNEDMHNALTGMYGYRGKVHLSFSKQIHCEDTASHTDIANLIDRTILDQYHFFASNLTALHYLKNDKKYRPVYDWLQPQYPQQMWTDEKMLSILDQAHANIRSIIAQMYANPCWFKWTLSNIC